ncbi:MAG: TerC family protein [Alphaproteobacteria bacterium]
MLHLFASPEAWMALATLTVLEIVLGIDNIVFISVLANRLPGEQRNLARKLGLAAALSTRLLLLLSLSWLASLTTPLFSVGASSFSWRDIILLVGGLFLIWKSTEEIHALMEPEDAENMTESKRKATFWSVITQIAVIDIVFSLDSVITAVGMVNQVPIMVAAILISVCIMFVAVNPINNFIHKHPTTKMLAFALLLLVGVALVADGMGFHIPKGYIYFGVAFSLGVEFLNIRRHSKLDKASFKNKLK